MLKIVTVLLVLGLSNCVTTISDKPCDRTQYLEPNRDVWFGDFFDGDITLGYVDSVYLINQRHSKDTIQVDRCELKEQYPELEEEFVKFLEDHPEHPDKV